MLVLQNLSQISHAPSVQMHYVPPDMFLLEDPEDKSNPDIKGGGIHRKEKDNEYYDGEDDQNVPNSGKLYD